MTSRSRAGGAPARRRRRGTRRSMNRPSSWMRPDDLGERDEHVRRDQRAPRDAVHRHRPSTPDDLAGRDVDQGLARRRTISAGRRPAPDRATGRSCHSMALSQPARPSTTRPTRATASAYSTPIAPASRRDPGRLRSLTGQSVAARGPPSIRGAHSGLGRRHSRRSPSQQRVASPATPTGGRWSSRTASAAARQRGTSSRRTSSRTSASSCSITSARATPTSPPTSRGKYDSLHGYADDVLEILEALGARGCRLRRPLGQRDDRRARRRTATRRASARSSSSARRRATSTTTATAAASSRADIDGAARCARCELPRLVGRRRPR